MRAVQIWGPLFCHLKYYDIKPVDSDGERQVFSFVTKKEYFPDKISLFGRGTLEINKETHRLEKIHFEYLDYHFLQLVYKNIPHPPFASTLELVFAYNENGPHVQSARLVTTWKHMENEKYGSIEIPSRRNPAKNHLVEKEAFRCEAFLKIPEEKQLEHLFKMVEVATETPIPFSRQTFDSLSPLLDREKAFEQLQQYHCLQQQFINNSNKIYYFHDYSQFPSISKNPLRFTQKAKKDVFDKFAY